MNNLADVPLDHCEGVVHRQGEMDECGKPAVAIIDSERTVAMMFSDDGAERYFWPACVWHAHRYGTRYGNRVVPLAEIVRAHRAAEATRQQP